MTSIMDEIAHHLSGQSRWRADEDIRSAIRETVDSLMARYLLDLSKEFRMTPEAIELMKGDFRAFLDKWRDDVWKADPAAMREQREMMTKEAPEAIDGMTLQAKMFMLSYYAGSSFGVLALSAVPPSMRKGAVLAMMDSFLRGIEVAAEEMEKVEEKRKRSKKNSGEKTNATSDDRSDAPAAAGKEGGTGEADAGV